MIVSVDYPQRKNVNLTRSYVGSCHYKQRDPRTASPVSKGSLMQTQIIVSAIGKDRPGIVHRISDAIFKRGGNITVQRSVKLGGEFAVILMFTVETKTETEVLSLLPELTGLADEHLQVSARVATSDSVSGESLRELRITGGDQPGIINTLTLFLLEQGVNIQSMDYTVASGPFTAAPIFNATVIFSTPSEASLERLEAGLREVERDLNVDAEFVDAAQR